MPYEWDYLGEEADLRVRGAMLDEGLEVLTGLWSAQPFRHTGAHYRIAGNPPDAEWGAIFGPPPLQQPRIPIWVGGPGRTKRPSAAPRAGTASAPTGRADRWRRTRCAISSRTSARTV